MNEIRHDLLPRWPALSTEEPLPHGLETELGIWGKAHGAATDFRWLAATPGFDRSLPPDSLYLGPEDRPVEAVLWRSLAKDLHAAVGIYPSQARDRAQRKGFLEKRLRLWKRPEGVPAVLGALHLLSAVSDHLEPEWWEDRDDPRWSDPKYHLKLPETPVLELDLETVEKKITKGIESLARALEEEDLIDLYAALLDGHRPAWLQREQPLTPDAMAALLLPLPRELADRVSVAGWIPSRSYDSDAFAEAWDLAISDLEAPQAPAESDRTPVTPVDPATAERAQRMARALLTADSGLLASSTTTKPVGSADPAPVRLALWGPSAAGKTALLAQLYIEGETDGEGWEVWPMAETRSFIHEMRRKKLEENRFPPATSPGKPERIEYKMVHSVTRSTAALEVEDRAGLESEELHPELKRSLISADGLLLVFDADRRPAKLEIEVSRTLDELAIHLDGTRDSRPVAVCLSKADLQIETLEDLDLAIADPDRFLRSRLQPRLLHHLDRRCSNYRLFPVSAVGVQARWGAVESFTFVDEYLEPRVCPGGRAINLREPFDWLFDQLGAAS